MNGADGAGEGGDGIARICSARPGGRTRGALLGVTQGPEMRHEVVLAERRDAAVASEPLAAIHREVGHDPCAHTPGPRVAPWMPKPHF